MLVRYLNIYIKVNIKEFICSLKSYINKKKYCACFQNLATRLQKERDAFQEELEKMKERIEFQQSQFLKSQRDREGMQTELEVIKDRWDKAHTQLQKLQVNIWHY